MRKISANYKTSEGSDLYYEIIYPTDYFSSTSICLFISFPLFRSPPHVFSLYLGEVAVCSGVTGVAALEVHKQSLTALLLFSLLSMLSRETRLLCIFICRKKNPSGSSLLCYPLYQPLHSFIYSTVQAHCKISSNTDILRVAGPPTSVNQPASRLSSHPYMKSIFSNPECSYRSEVKDCCREGA